MEKNPMWIPFKIQTNDFKPFTESVDGAVRHRFYAGIYCVSVFPLSVDTTKTQFVSSQHFCKPPSSPSPIFYILYTKDHTAVRVCTEAFPQRERTHLLHNTKRAAPRAAHSRAYTKLEFEDFVRGVKVYPKTRTGRARWRWCSRSNLVRHHQPARLCVCSVRTQSLQTSRFITKTCSRSLSPSRPIHNLVCENVRGFGGICSGFSVGRGTLHVMFHV